MSGLKKGLGGLLLLVMLVQMACGGGHNASIVGKWQYVDTTVKEGEDASAEDLEYLAEEKQELLEQGNWMEFKSTKQMLSSNSPGQTAKYQMSNGNTRIIVKVGRSEEWMDVITLTDDKLAISYEEDNFVYHFNKVAK